MNSDDSLGKTYRFLLDIVIGLRPCEERDLLEVSAGASAFLYFTGQIHRFESHRRHPSSALATPSRFDREIRLLERMSASLPSDEARKTLLTAIQALRFVESSNQLGGLEDSLEYWRSGGLPPVVAAFKTYEEAEAWVKAQPAPPYHAAVLIADIYFHVVEDDSSERFHLSRKAEEVDFIEKHSREGLPPVVASFETREEAETWFASLPAPPRHAFIQIQGTHHVAAWWKNVNHRALYSFTLAEEYAREMRAFEEALARGKATEGEHP